MKTTAHFEGRRIGGVHLIACKQATLTILLVIAISDAFAGDQNECSMTANRFVSSSGLACCSGIASGNGIRAKLISGRIHTSPDGRLWTERPLPFQTFLRDITYAGGMFVAVGGSYMDEPGVIVTSPNGLHWTRKNPRNRITLNSITWGNGSFVAVGDHGTVLISTNGGTWKSQRSPTNSMLAKVLFGNGVFVAGGESGTILTSSNGVHWTTSNLGASLFVGTIHFHGNTFLVKGSDVTFTSTNGLTWKPDHPDLAAVPSVSK
jgi:hypothetical protein